MESACSLLFTLRICFRIRYWAGIPDSNVTRGLQDVPELVLDQVMKYSTYIKYRSFKERARGREVRREEDRERRERKREEFFNLLLLLDKALLDIHYCPSHCRNDSIEHHFLEATKCY